MRRGNHLTLTAERGLYAGSMPATGWHQHAAVALLLGLSGRFLLHLHDGRTAQCRSAWVDVGVEHVFDPCGEEVALVYLEPDTVEAQRVRALLAREGGVLFDVVRPGGTRSTIDGRLQAFDIESLCRLPRQPRAVPLDARVAHSLRLLRQVGERPWARGQAALNVQLSSSRFNHLFREQAGVSFRSYRVWCQVRAAIMGMGPALNLTEAALHGAFADSSHFSRTFRATFGMTPSSVLKSVTQVVVRP